MDVALGSHLAKGAIAIGRIDFGADFLQETHRVLGTDLT